MRLGEEWGANTRAQGITGPWSSPHLSRKETRSHFFAGENLLCLGFAEEEAQPGP